MAGTITTLNTSQPPTVYGSMLLNSLESVKTEIGSISFTNILATSISDGFATLSGGTLSNLNNPTASQDAVTRDYIDIFHWKQPTKTASTANIPTLSGLLTLDTVALSNGDRVLVKDQTDQTQNGIYTVSTGPWTRSPDFSSGTLVGGSGVVVNQGSANGDTLFICTSNFGADTVGTNSLVFQEVSGGGGGGGTPGGSNTQIQFNDSGSFGGSSNLTWDGSTLQVSGGIGSNGIVQLTNTTNSTNTSNGALVVDGGVGIDLDLNVGGDVFANEFVSISDINLKRDIEEIDNPLSLLNKIDPVKYTLTKSNKTHYGVIAQDLQQDFNDSVKEVNGHLAVNYNDIVGILIASVQELNQKVNSIL